MSDVAGIGGARGEGGMPTDWSELFPPGESAAHPFGVLYQGEYETPHDGTNQAVRLHARALAQHFPVLLKSFSNVVVTKHGAADPAHLVDLDPEIVATVGPLRETSIGTLVPLIKHAVVRSGEHLRQILVPRGVFAADPDQLIRLRNAILNATIAYTVWERDRIPDDIAVWLRRAAECWVPCQQNADLLINAGVAPERVCVVPHPYDPADPILLLTRRKPIAERCFYSIGRWEPRKGYHELVGAFLLAFLPGENVRLTIKTTDHQWADYVRAIHSLNVWSTDQVVRRRGWTPENIRRHIEIIPRVLGADQIRKLHFENNIYVSSSHGEAWNLGAYAAKIAGNRLVHVPWGGTTDFATDGDVAVETTGLDPVPESYGWGSARWMSYQLEALAAALASAAPPARYERSAGFEARFSLAAVGKLMAQRVLRVAEGVSAEAAAYLRQQQAQRSGVDNAGG